MSHFVMCNNCKIPSRHTRGPGTTAISISYQVNHLWPYVCIVLGTHTTARHCVHSIFVSTSLIKLLPPFFNCILHSTTNLNCAIPINTQNAYTIYCCFCFNPTPGFFVPLVQFPRKQERRLPSLP